MFTIKHVQLVLTDLLQVQQRLLAIPTSPGVTVAGVGGGIGSIGGVGVGGIALSRGVKALGDGVQPGGRAKGDIAIGQVGGISLGLSLTLAQVVVAGGGVGVAEAIAVRVGGSVGGGVGKGGRVAVAVGQTGGVAVGQVGRVSLSLGLGLSLALAKVVVGGVGDALGHGVQALGDGVKAAARSEGDTVVSNSGGVGVGGGIGKAGVAVSQVGGVRLSSHGGNQTGL